MVLHPKHQKKVLECYPTASESQSAMSLPISAKLSALIYYINAKPQKLIKVMPFLEKKTRKDFVRQSFVYNMVTIGIFDGIIKHCGEYFDGYASTYLEIMILFTETIDEETEFF